MNIDDLLNDLHADRATTIEDELTRVEREIARRRLISAETVVNLFGQISDLHQQILRLQPEHEFALDHQRAQREPLERECRQLERDLKEELRSRWRDVQELRREQRQLLRQAAEEQQRYTRHTNAYQ